MTWTRSILGLAILLAAGCGQRFDKELSYPMEPGDNRYIEVDAPRGEQKVQVTLQTGGVPVDVYIVLADSIPLAQQALRNQSSPGIVARVSQLVDPQVEAIIPAGRGFVVAISNNSNKPTTVTGRLSAR